MALGAFTLLLILFTSYTLMRLAPGDPAKSTMLSGGAAGKDGAGSAGVLSGDKSEVGRNLVLEKKLNMDKPLVVGFFLWLKAAAHGDFGTSVAVDKGRSVTTLIMERLPVTLRLNIIAILLTYLLAIPLGIQSALHPDTKLDRAMTFFLFFLYSLPGLWVALMLQSAFCKGGLMPIFPLKGLAVGSPDGLSTWSVLLRSASHYVLPVFCLSYASFAGITRFTRAGMLDVIRQDYIRTARAKGVPERDVIYVHAFRNALIILITLFAGILPSLVSGSILIEYIFNIPGMGELSMTALSSRDIPLVMALFSFGGFLTLTGILLADILYVIADPRICFSSRN
ncbi:MAG: ABC transporter permease [Lentisphaeria bacterium]|nr:ABC transporter permease [Lentisphaeria bacterium]